MEKFYPVLLKSNLFKHISLADMPMLLDKVEPSIRYFSAGNRIWQAGDSAKEFGLVCAGKVQIVKENQRGNRMILALIEPAGIFGEAYAYAAAGTLPVSVDVVEDATVLFFRPAKLIAQAHLPQGPQLIQNMMQILATKSLMLNQKIEVLSQRKITDKVLTFLQLEQAKQHRNHLVIPYNRQEMADFLGVERSALSTALGEMKKERLLDYHKNEFTLF